MTTDDKPKQKSGFAVIPKDKARNIQKMGGKASGANFARDPKRAAEMGRRGAEARRKKAGNDA